MTTRFFKRMLRTLEVDAARAFYAAVLGNVPLDAVPLHEQAIANGARPHWLGYLEVEDPEATAAELARRGAIRRGPKLVNPEGLEFAMLHDPGGAILAVAKPPASMSSPSGPDVAWNLLHTNDVQRARVDYSELFGWELGAPVDRGPLGVFHPFAYEPGGEPVGALTDVRSRPGVHPHWLFHFRVPALQPAVHAVRASRGKVVAEISLPTGEQIAVCDDPQGAAFALWQG